MPLGLLDLSLVTDRLIAHLTGCTASSKLWDEDTITPPANPKFTIHYTGLAPDAARTEKDGADCQVSVYLFHVSADKFHRNTFPLGGPAQTNTTQPFALTLYYLLTAYAKSSYVQEQQAMSVALKCFHEHPIVTATVPIDSREEEFTLSIEPQTIDEISRLWQAINAPIRLSAVYRVGVIFLEASSPKGVDVVRHAPDFVGPRGIQILDDEVPEQTLPGAAGHARTDVKGFATIEVKGAGFDTDPTGATEVKIRARSLTRSTNPPLPGQFQGTSQNTLDLRVPLYTPQGRYLLSVRPPLPDKPIAQFWLDVPERVVLVETDATGFATIIIDDAGFADGVTTVRIDGPPGTSLAATQANSPGAGQFHVVDKETLRVRVPSPLAAGRHLLTLGRGPNEFPLELWLKVP